MRAIDLFAGPGGWDLAALELGFRPLGIELDDAACATRIAAEHPTIQADVSILDPLAYAPCELLIGSPPCPTFSVAGSRAGGALVGVIVDCLRGLLAGQDLRAGAVETAERILKNGEKPEHAVRDAKMSMLVVEPMRWALALEPDFIALEQVPPVLDLWKVYARALEERGYSTWAGVLSSEQYGVPQTRTRALMLASKRGLAHPPRPTHQAYVPGEPAAEQHTLEGVLLPWVSMAEAQPHRRERPVDEPAPTIAFGHDSANWRWEPGDVVGFPRRADTPSNRAGDDVVEIDGTEYRERDLRSASEPAFALTEKTRSWTRWTVRTGMNSMSSSRNPEDMVPYERDVDAPAPTLTTDARRWKIAPEGEHVDPPMKWKTGDPLELKGDDWPERRPATTIAGDALVFQPGGHHEEGQQSANAIVVEPHEAAVLQSFPPDYPWQGSRTAVFQQIGNAVPPLLAYHVLKELLHV